MAMAETNIYTVKDERSGYLVIYCISAEDVHSRFSFLFFFHFFFSSYSVRGGYLSDTPIGGINALLAIIVVGMMVANIIVSGRRLTDFCFNTSFFFGISFVFEVIGFASFGKQSFSSFGESKSQTERD